MSKEYLEVKDLQAKFIKCFNELLTKTDKDIIVVNISREMAQDMVNLYEKYSTVKPSEALELIDSVREYSHSLTMVNYLAMNSDLDIIKETIIKSQEQEKLLDVIKEYVMPLVNIDDDCVWDNEGYGFLVPKKEDLILLKKFSEE